MENALFDLDSRGWNAHLIYGIFLPFKAQLIKSLSIASSSQEDVLFGHIQKLDYIRLDQVITFSVRL